MPPRVYPRGSMNQAGVFYTPEWSKEVDDLFILGLCEQTAVGNWLEPGGRPNRQVIGYARDRVNGHYGSHFSYSTCLNRFRRLYQRYIVFKHIIDHPGVEHNENSNYVTAPEAVWNTICRDHALAYAYMRQGEGSFPNLQFIFTANERVPVVEEDEVEVIEISSDHSALSAEVDNGGVFDGQLAWHNSFNSANTDVLSSTVRDTGTSSVNMPSRSPTNAGRRNAIPRRVPTSGPSSQASSSPFKPV